MSTQTLLPFTSSDEPSIVNHLVVRADYRPGLSVVILKLWFPQRESPLASRQQPQGHLLRPRA